MNRRILAVCDSDRDYLNMLHTYFFKKNPAGFEIRIFDSVKRAAEASKEESFEILLVGEKIYDNNVSGILAQKILILQEDGLSDISGFGAVSKYQSMERLMGQVLDAFALDEKCVSTESAGRTAASLISFYSPERHKAQSVAALAAAQALSDMGNRVLYISMQPFSGFEQILCTKYEADITDFLYFVLKHSDKLPYKLEGIKRTIHGVDYLPPALDYSDLCGITEREWEECLDMLLHGAGYTHIVVDLTETCRGFYRFLEKSDTVYVLAAQDALADAMYTQFAELIRSKDMSAALEKQVRFNMIKGWESYVSDLSRLSHSPVGVHMKGILGQDGQHYKV